ncbi:MAG: hypothetical protein FWG66_03820 [Spirochaetes bacterium]|nr:hypothetical protein [Spirochaetota bacterium]
MARKFAELREKMSLEARAKSEEMFEEAVEAMSLHELNSDRGLSQKTLAEALNVQQPAQPSIS